MTNSVGLFIYRLISKHKDTKELCSVQDNSLNKKLIDIIDEITQATASINDKKKPTRSLTFETKDKKTNNSVRFGHIKYGINGFESELIDQTTKRKQYTRLVTDTEIIPLYYHFWVPENSSHAYVAFQTFQGRSCVILATDRIKLQFEKENPNITLFICKIMLDTINQKEFFDAPVKKLRLIRQKTPSDIADKYGLGTKADEINLELTFNANRNGIIGKVSQILEKIKGQKPNSIIEYNGIAFEKAVADIRIGKKTRTVELIGLNKNAGIIDLTDKITFDSNGHPNLNSISAETTEILEEVDKIYNGDQS